MKNSSDKQKSSLKSRKILLAIDTSSSSVNYLEKAAELAFLLNAQLSCLYIEDEDLLAAADLPFVKEVCLHVNEKTIDHVQIERDMELFSCKTRVCFEEIAARWKINGSFQTVRGKVIGELSQAAQTADILSYGMQVFRDLQNSSLSVENIHADLPWLLFPDQIANGDDIIVFASNEKSLEELLAPVNGLVKRSRVIVFCTPKIYSENKEKISDFLHHSAMESQVVINAGRVNDWNFDLLFNYNPGLIVVDKNSNFSKSKNFYILMNLAKAPGLLVGKPSCKIEPESKGERTNCRRIT